MAVNNVVLVGRLATDVKVNEIGNGVKQARFTLAVDRQYKRRNADKPDTDFIKISVVRGGADFAERYFTKGKQVSVVGSLETYSYTKEDETFYDFCIKAERLGFADSVTGSNSTNRNNDSAFEAPDDFDFMTSEDLPGDDLPF